MAGGGVDPVILDVSLSQKPEIERLDSFLKLRGAAPHMPIVVVCGLRRGQPAPARGETGSRRLLVARALRYRSGHRGSLRHRQASGATGAALPFGCRVPPGRRGNRLPGRKGRSRHHYRGAECGFRARAGAQSFSPNCGQYSERSRFTFAPVTWLAISRASWSARTGAPAEIEACLWTCKALPGLSILFGPQTIEECWEIAARPAQAILQAASMLADYVVVDLPPSFSMANRAVMLESDSLVLIVEREPLYVKCQTDFGEHPRLGRFASGHQLGHREPRSSPGPHGSVGDPSATRFPTLGLMPLQRISALPPSKQVHRCLYSAPVRVSSLELSADYRPTEFTLAARQPIEKGESNCDRSQGD